MMDLLNSKIGSKSPSLSNKNSGILLTSVSNPTQRNDLLRMIFSNNSSLVISIVKSKNVFKYCFAKIRLIREFTIRSQPYFKVTEKEGTLPNRQNIQSVNIF